MTSLAHLRLIMIVMAEGCEVILTIFSGRVTFGFLS